MGPTARGPLIVAGMHRSGTSFVASLLREAGVDMGARLMPASHGNQLGHFENLDFVGFHRRHLTLCGYDDAGWMAPAGLPDSTQAREEADEIVTANARRTAWGWKDPRTTLFLSFWQSIMPEAQFLFLYRDPAEVIDSLFRRGDAAIVTTPQLAAAAWKNHNGIIVEFARRCRERCYMANTTAIVQRPSAFLQQLAERFDLDIDIDVRSTFNADMMRLGYGDSSHGKLLRYFDPSIEALYADLQAEADLPLGGDRPRITQDRAFEAFFAEWRDDSRKLTASHAAQRAHVKPPADQGATAPSDANTTNQTIIRLQAELEKYGGAVAAFATDVDASWRELGDAQPRK